MDGHEPTATPNAAPTSPAPGGAASEATQGQVKGKGKPGGSQGRGGSHRDRRDARRLAAAEKAKDIQAAPNKQAVPSHARADVLPAIAAALAGSERPLRAPLPLSVACDLHGYPVRTMEDQIRAGKHPTIDRARAEGVALCVRMAMTAEDPKPWQWLAERLRPKDLHLPTKITGVSAEDGGAPIQAATVAVQLTADGRRRELQAIAAEAQAALAALPAGK